MFKFVTAFVAVNIKAQNKLCGHYNFHTEFVKRLYHSCSCPTDNGDNPHIRCQNILKEEVKSLVDNQDFPGLQSISQHDVQNAMYDLSFDGTEDGTHGANPLSPLHILELGLDEYLSKGLSMQLG